MAISSHVPRTNRQVTLRVIGHYKTVGHHYGNLLPYFWRPESGGGFKCVSVLKDLWTSDYYSRARGGVLG
jgi:hypothetical protein